MSMTDRSDPLVRAAERLHHTAHTVRRRRLAAGVVLLAAAIATLAAAGPLLEGDGAWVGAVVTALALCAWAVAVWPQAWSPAESRHREFDAIWRELRSDADDET